MPLEDTPDVSPTVDEGISFFAGLGKFGVFSQGMSAKKQGILGGSNQQQVHGNY